MKSSKLTTHALAAVALAAGALVSQAQAAPLISVNLSTSNIQIGNVLGVDINISGLTPVTGALGAFAFDLDYDGARFAFSFFAADPDTKMGNLANPAVPLSGGNAGSSVNFLVLAGLVPPTPEAVLAGLQGGGFTMGRVELTATNLGFASLNISNFSLSDYLGNSMLGVTARGAQVCVSTDGVTPCRNVIPEPTTPLLVLAALGALALNRKQQTV
jgi:hypothetical protein